MKRNEHTLGRTLPTLNDWRYQTPFSKLTHNAQLRAICDLHVGGGRRRDPSKNTLRSTLSPDYRYCIIAHGSPRFPKYEVFVCLLIVRRNILCVILRSQSAGKRKKPRMAPTARVFRSVLRTGNKLVILLETGSTGPFIFHIHRGSNSPLLTGLAINPPVWICIES